MIEKRNLVFSLIYYFIIGNYHSLDLFLWIPTNNNCLQYLNIKRFPTLMYFQKDALPVSLMHLHLQNCKNLEFLTSESMPNYSSLVYLTLSDSCHSLQSFSLGSSLSWRDSILTIVQTLNSSPSQMTIHAKIFHI